MLLGACPSCRATARRPWFRHPQLRLWLCTSCGLGYTDPQPRAAVRHRYESAYDLAEHFGAHEPRKSVLNSRRLDRLPPPRPGGKLLDVGCGDGQFAAAAHARGWEPHGVELNPPAARRARERGVLVREGRLEDLDFEPASFELVTAWDVIEHVPDPAAFIDHLVRAVAPGGRIVVTTLNRKALVARAFRGRWSMVVIDHFTYWDARSLRAAFARTGLRATEATSFGLGRDFVAWIDRAGGRPSSVAQATTRASPSAASTEAGWDTQGLVLRVESAVNRLLDRTMLGVGIELRFQASPPPR